MKTLPVYCFRLPSYIFTVSGSQATYLLFQAPKLHIYCFRLPSSIFTVSGSHLHCVVGYLLVTHITHMIINAHLITITHCSPTSLQGKTLLTSIVYLFKPTRGGLASNVVGVLQAVFVDVVTHPGQVSTSKELATTMSMI
jgi:hypothetical protein